MASVNRELEQQLREAGNKLAELPSSVDELLPLLDQVETFLSRVEQSPPASMQDALAPSLNALVKDELLRHSDFDAKVAVASCISEITRITAPDAPYQDDKMKDVFQLIVSSFENLSDKSSRSFIKMASILETVAKVRSCVVMLDLECDGLIVEMFQHFLKSIRDYHPENVFTSMETIMSLVLEESEDISLELLTPLLASVKNDSEEVLPIARKLGERVFEICAPKLRPCLLEAVKSLGISLDDYSKVVASVCEGTTTGVVHNDDNTLGEQSAEERKLTNASSDEAAQVDGSKLTTASTYEPAQVSKERVTEEACPEVEPTADRSSPKPVVSNGVTETGNEEKLVDPESSKEPENNVDVGLSNKGDAADDSADTVKSVKPKPKQEQSAKRKGKKTSSVNSLEPSDASRAGSEKEAEKPPVRSKNRGTGARTTPALPPVESNEPSDNETEAGGIQLSPKKTLESKAVHAASPSPSGTLPAESRQKKGARTKKKEVVIEEEKPPSVDDSSKKESEIASDSELKPQKRTGKKATATTKNDKSLASVGTSKNEDDTTNDLESKPLKQSGKKGESSESEAKPLKQSGKKGDSSNNIEEKSPLRKKDRKGRGRGKDTAEELTTSSAKDDVKEAVSSPKSTAKSAEDDGNIDETPKTDSKRKRSTPGTGKNKATNELAENVVGLTVRVYWPKDREFYKGVIESFDPATKKHKVSYDDGETEILTLKKERWEVIEEDPVPNEEKEIEDPSPDASPEMPKKKKAKTSPEPSAKQEKTPVSPKRSGAASSSKTKGTAAKSGRNNESKEDGKVTSASKPSGKSENSGSKSQDNSKKTGGKGFDDTLKSAMKSTKQDTPKPDAKSKGKTAKRSGESITNGSGKAKSSLAKGKETEDSKGKTAESAKTPENAKGKATEASKSGKKRKKRS